MFILSFSISFVSLVVILLIFYVSFSFSSFSGTQHQLTHPPARSSTLSGRRQFFRILHLSILISLYLASSIFWTKHQLTYTQVKCSSHSGKELDPSSHENFLASSLFETQHQASSIGLIIFSQEYVRFSGRSSQHNVFMLSRVGSL